MKYSGRILLIVLLASLAVMVAKSVPTPTSSVETEPIAEGAYDRNDCKPNPCVRGTCTDLISSFHCDCPPGYTGTRCELVRGTLRIYARYGSGLPDRDGWFAGNSDPYVKVTAYRRSGSPITHTTSHDQGDESPEWYEWLYFGNDYWTHFTVKVYDRDVGSDDSLSGTTTYYLNDHITRTNVRNNCDSGYIIFDYYYQP